MNISKKGIDLIKSFEGFYGKPYLDVVNVPTIGYGTTYYLPDKRKVTLKDPAITEQRATEMLTTTLQIYENDVKRLVKSKINQNQFDALVSFTYNLGGANLGSSTLLKKVNINPNDPSIRAEFAKWKYAGKKEYAGLVRRRKAEADLYFS